jgi:hypothetical protein
MNFLEKYLKYKNKYLKLKNQFGGTCTICNMDHQGTSCPQYDKSSISPATAAAPASTAAAPAATAAAPAAAAAPAEATAAAAEATAAAPAEATAAAAEATAAAAEAPVEAVEQQLRDDSKIINMYKYMKAYDINTSIQNIINKIFLDTDYIFKNQIYFINSGMIKIKNGENIDENIIILKSGDFMSDDIDLTTHSFDYLTPVLSKYRDMNLFITIAPVTLKEYYLPLFLDQYLEENQSEELVVMIIGRNYNAEYTGFGIDMKTINDYLGVIKTKFNTRVKFIHVYTNFNFNILEFKCTEQELQMTKPVLRSFLPKRFSKIFKGFLSNNYHNRKLNILYIGFNSCGKIENIDNEDINNIFIGCDSFKYKSENINFDTSKHCSNFRYPANTFSDVPVECKISYEVISKFLQDQLRS